MQLKLKKHVLGLENCNSCANGSPKTFGENKLPISHSYSDDRNKGDTIAIQGPLSNLFRQALMVKFQSTGIDGIDAQAADNNLDNASELEENKKPATESQAQDAYIEEVLNVIANTPGAEVVLSNFNYETVQKRVNDFTEGKLTVTDKDIDESLIVPVRFATVDEMKTLREMNENRETPINIVLVSRHDTIHPGDRHAKNYEQGLFIGAGGNNRVVENYADNPVVTTDDVIVDTTPKTEDNLSVVVDAYEQMGHRVFPSLESFVSGLGALKVYKSNTHK